MKEFKEWLNKIGYSDREIENLSNEYIETLEYEYVMIRSWKCKE